MLATSDDARVMDGRKVRAGFHCMWVCGYVREENTTEADFDAGALGGVSLTQALCISSD